MASGFRRRRGEDEYLFIDGRALRPDEVVRIDVEEAAVPGQAEAQGGDARAAGRRTGRTVRATLDQLEREDALALNEQALEGLVSLTSTKSLMADDRRKLRQKYLAFGLALLVCFVAASCYSQAHGFFSPVELVQSLASSCRLAVVRVLDPGSYTALRLETLQVLPYYAEVTGQCGEALKWLLCGALLAVAGMLYQNTFRNPIAAPSMLGVSNGVNIALLVLVLQLGSSAYEHVGLYYLYSFVGGAAVLVLVLLGGKWISGKGQFNVVNMILMGMIFSQMLGVLITLAQTNFLSDQDWNVYYLLESATGITSVWTYVSLFVGGLCALVPIFVFRFKLNLVSFSDGETRLLGVDPNKLRILALTCGSLMMLTAQVNVGDAAMVSLVVPFVVRAVFGAEFRKQLGGNVLVGALVLLVCGELSVDIIIAGMPIGLSVLVTMVALPLFVWMLVIRQRSWE